MTPQNPMQPASKDLSAEALARRRAVIGVLGKGTAAVAALTPLASNASRSHKLYNSVLGKDCYCTVSGFQSAAISAVPSVSCAAYKPETFVTVSADVDFVTSTNTFKLLPLRNKTFVYTGATIKTTNVIGNGNGGGNNSDTYNGPLDFQAWLIRHLRNGFSTINITNAAVSGFLSGTPSVAIAVSAQSTLVKWKSNTLLSVYTGKNFPGDISSTGAFNTIFNSSDARSLLEVLSDTGSGKRFFLAAFLSIDNSTLGEVLPTEITRAYVKSNYSDAVAGNPSSDEYAFFSALCSKSA